MNKSDLKDGMMLRLRNNNIYSLLHGNLLELSLDDTYKIVASIYDYDDEFKNFNVNVFDNYEMDVVRIYDKDMNELWERYEVDWSKVPTGTKVMVKFNYEDTYKEGIFIGVSDNGRFLTYDKSAGILHWNYCVLVEESKEEITCNELNEAVDKICKNYIMRNGTCKGCVAFNDKYECDKGIIARKNFIITKR